jgi:glycosyltransferase involved in cell wall biosynthesis
MNLLFLTQYYPPETGAAQNRISDLARRLATWGHNVTVLTALPSYPKGEIFEGYRGKLVLDETIDGIRVLRVWTYTTKSKSFVRRLLNYFSFVLGSILVGVAKSGPQDVLIVESPPLFLGLSGLLLSKLRHSKMVFNVSDLWPESAVSLGILRSKLLVGIATALEEFIYRRSDLITGQTQGIVDKISARTPAIPVALVTNGVDIGTFSIDLNAARERIRRDLGMERAFVVGYAGLHGLAQGLETLLQAADRLRGQENIQFVFFGDGPEKTRLTELAREKALANVRFYPPEPKVNMPSIMAAFDASIVPLKRLDLFRGALPCKLFESMAAAVPVIVSIEGEARALVEQAGAGICVPPEDGAQMAEAILKLRSNPALRISLGQSARKYVIGNYNRETIAKRFDHLLSNLGVPSSTREIEVTAC